MILNEAVATQRTVKARLYASDGTPLPSGHSFSAGDLKIVQPDGTVANATNLPTSIAGSATGTFDIIVAQAQLQQLGQIRLQLSASGVQFWEWVEPVEYSPLLTNDTRLDNLDAAISSRLAPTVAARTLDITATGAAGIDWGNVENTTTAHDMSNTTVAGGGGGGGGSGPTAAEVAAAVMAFVMDPNAPAGAQKFQEVVNILMSVAAGNATGLPSTLTGTLSWKSLDGTKTRLAGTIASGVRTITAKDGT